MIYTLMHLDDAVLSFDMNSDGHVNTKSIVLINEKLIPVGAETGIKFSEWWEERAIPETRQFIKELKKQDSDASNIKLNIKNYALSLKDVYWIKPLSQNNIKWSDINLFENDFLDRYNLISEIKKVPKEGEKLSPASSPGELEKYWYKDANNNVFLVKGNYSNKIQQSLNELFATKLLERLKFNDFVSYDLVDVRCDAEKSVGCRCKSYTSDKVESYSLWQLLKKYNRTNAERKYTDSIKLLTDIGVNNPTDYLEKQIVIDYILTNLDRHMNNIEILRDTKTLKTIGMAPMFDFGNSMFFRYNSADNLPNDNKFERLETRSFSLKESKLLKHVKNKIEIDYDAILDRNLFDEVYLQDTTKDAEFYDALYRLYKKKVDKLRNYMNTL